MASERPLIFISNDDGVEAPGLKYLIDYVKKFGDVIAVAPAGPHSGQSSAISIDKPLRIKRHADYNGAQIYSVTGTPVDCVKLGLHAIAPRRPDLLLAGINHGSNSGNSTIYSGTMGAVFEGCMVGIPAIGFSLTTHSWEADFSGCEDWVPEIVEKVLAGGLPGDVCLNVNIPARCRPRGVKLCHAARGHWSEEYQEYADPMGKPFYFLTGRFTPDNPDDDAADIYWLDREYITIVPVRPDQTAFDAIDTLSAFQELFQ